MLVTTCNSQTQFTNITKHNPNHIVVLDCNHIYYPLSAFPPVLKANNVKDMIDGLIFGQCIADATGLAGEFMQSDQVARNYTFGKLGPTVRLSDDHRDTWKKGDWTDDSDHMILVLQSLYTKNPAETFYAKLCHWYYHGFPELGDKAGCGIGQSIRLAVIDREEFDLSISQSNGCIMRCAVVGILHNQKWQTVKALAIDMCKTTHTHPKCITACVFITSLVWNILNGMSDVNTLIRQAYSQSVDQLQGKKKRIIEFKQATKVAVLSDFVLDPIHSRGYVYLTLISAVYCLRNWYKGFEYLINEITFKGGDADTNCAVSGAVLGAYLGYQQLPKKWINELIHKEWLRKQIDCWAHSDS